MLVYWRLDCNTIYWNNGTTIFIEYLLLMCATIWKSLTSILLSNSQWRCCCGVYHIESFHHRPWRKFAADTHGGCHLALVSSLYVSPIWREPHGSRLLVAWPTWGWWKSTWKRIQFSMPLAVHRFETRIPSVVVLFGNVRFKTTFGGNPTIHVVTSFSRSLAAGQLLNTSLESWVDSGGLNAEL